MPEIVALKVREDDKNEVVSILEEALDRARRGEVRDCAVVLAVHDEDGPQHGFHYYGEGAYSVLLAGVVSLQHDMLRRAYD